MSAADSLEQKTNPRKNETFLIEMIILNDVNITIVVVVVVVIL